jgi:uncharacterized protein YjbJ (UPF0337 family)
MNKDQVKGRLEEVKGKAKAVTGKVTGNAELEDDGRIDEAAGRTRADYGDAKNAVKGAVKDAVKGR